MNTDLVNSHAVLHRNHWRILSIIVAFAAILRIVFFNGFFGSDDIVYLNRSYQIAQGIWESANYNGALRYGYNIPAGFFIWLFGLNAFTANLWTLLCSLFEVAVVFWFANRYLNRRTAIYASLIVATLPLHIALATRIHADPVLACFLTLSFVLLYSAEQNRRSATYFAAGLAMGMVFWVKELAAVTFVAIATYPLLARRFDRQWSWLIAGGLAMLAGHLLLMWLVAGDPLHLITTVSGQVERGFVQSGAGEDRAGYYFWYLLAEIKHTWLVGYIALGGVVIWLIGRRGPSGGRDETAAGGYVVWWLATLLCVLSFLPVSLDPFRFVMKQSNYLNLFLAPMAILAALMLARIEASIIRVGLLSVALAGGIALGAIEQAAYKVFTANSRAAIEFARAHPNSWILGSVNNANMASIYATLESDEELSRRFGYLRNDVKKIVEETPAVGQTESGYVVLDRESGHWGTRAFMPAQAPQCWNYVQTLEPHSVGGSAIFIAFLKSLAGRTPNALSDRVKGILDDVSQPRPAMIYRADITNLWCIESTQSVK